MSRSAQFLIGHREWAPGRKFDPRHSMDWRRGQVAQVLAGPSTSPTPKPPANAPANVEGEDMYAVVSDPAGNGDYGTNGVTKFQFTSQEAKNDWAKKFGAKRIELRKDAFDNIPTVKGQP